MTAHTHIVRTQRSEGGYSLIEMLVTVGIMTLITGIALANHTQFSNTALFSNLAYDIALSVRQAQVYGISVREVESTSSFDDAYGVHFDANTPTEYVLFSDADDDGVYDGSGEALEVYSISRGNTIIDLCAIAGGTNYCSSTGDLSTIDVTFKRPDPDAQFATQVAGPFDSIEITIQSQRGATRNISVGATGQISVGTLAPPGS